MKNFMKLARIVAFSIVAATVIVFALSGNAISENAAPGSLADDPVNIHSGSKGGGYDRFTQDLRERLAQRGLAATVVNHNGSDAITLAACQDEGSIFVAQADALYKREMIDSQGCSLTVLEVYGTETAMLLVPKDSDIDDLDDDFEAHHKILVGKVGTGSELTFKNMQAIEKEHGGGDEWSDAKTVNSDVRRASALAKRGDIDAVFMVMSPNDDRVHALLKKGWKFAQLWDKDINDLEYGDAPLYEPYEFVAHKDKKRWSEWGYKVTTYIGTTEFTESDDPDLFYGVLSALE